MCVICKLATMTFQTKRKILINGIIAGVVIVSARSINYQHNRNVDHEIWCAT